MEFEHKVAVITGGGSGIGRSVAITLARLGVDIVIADIDDTKMEQVSKEVNSIGSRALTIHCDVSKDSDVDNLAAQALSTMGRVDILMNNAGVILQGPVEKLNIADWEWIVGINLLGVVRGIHAFLPHMLKRGNGYIINTASSAGLIGIPDIGYSTTKFGIVGLSESLYVYLRPKGIAVSVLCPGMVATNLPSTTRHVGNDQEVKGQKTLLEKAFSGQDAIHPDEVAQAVVKAMEEKQLFITTDTEWINRLKDHGYDVHKLEKHLED